MKPADLAVLVLCLVLAGGAIGAFYWWRGNEERAADARYEAGIDEVVDAKIRTVGLDFLGRQLAAAQDRPAALRALYADPAQADRLNMGFGTLQGDFATRYANYAEDADRAVERDRFQREVDERWGDGAFEVMSTQYAAFLADAPRRQAEENAQLLRECLSHARLSEERGNCQAGYARAQAALGITP